MNTNKPVCVLQSPIFTRSGYGDWALEVAKSLLRYDKYELYIAATPWGACSKKNLESEINDDEGKQLLGKILKTNLPKQPELFIQMTIPNEFVTPAKYNIGMTAGIETTVPPAQWIEGINRMNLTIVTSQHSKDVFNSAIYKKELPNGLQEDIRVKSPIEILFWGANTKIYHKTTDKINTLEESMLKIPESYAFLFVGQWTSGNIQCDRKNIGFLIKTFLETFSGIDNPPCLILKTNGAKISTMDQHECINKIHDLYGMVKQSKPNTKLPNVYLLHGELNDREMNALFNHEKVKVHISFTHGEGFGHPLLLATLSGKPVITPKWSGHLDFLNLKLARFFPGKLETIPDQAVNDWFMKGSAWFSVDYDEAGKMLKKIYLDPDPSLFENAEKLRIENEQKFSIKAMDSIFHSLLDRYVPQFPVEQPLKLPKLKRIKFNDNA